MQASTPTVTLSDTGRLHFDLKSYRKTRFGISPVADFSKVKLSLLDTVTEKVPTFAV